MPHKCIKCGQSYPDGAKQLLEGCSDCKGKFFYFIKNGSEAYLPEIETSELKEIESDIRDLIGEKSEEGTIILDLETIQVTRAGKYRIDLTKIFEQKRPIVYRVEEGKYVIDLSSILKVK